MYSLIIISFFFLDSKKKIKNQENIFSFFYLFEGNFEEKSLIRAMIHDCLMTGIANLHIYNYLDIVSQRCWRIVCKILINREKNDNMEPILDDSSINNKMIYITLFFIFLFYYFIMYLYIVYGIYHCINFLIERTKFMQE